MRDILSGKQNPIGKKLSDSRGMTMGELLVVVAIVLVLSGVAFISVINHQRTLAQLERDGIAKEIFVAAQNHLTMAKGENYLGVKDYGKKDTTSDSSEYDVYYYIVDKGTVSPSAKDATNQETAASDMFGQTLPFGSIEENIRGGGSYLIRYQPKTGLVLDVFYCSTGDRFGHSLALTEYDGLMSKRGDANKEARKTFSGKAVLGWYGGTNPEQLEEVALNPPKIKVVNKEMLYVEIAKTGGKYLSAGTDYTTYGIRLLITGRTKGLKLREHYIDVQLPNGDINGEKDENQNPVVTQKDDKYIVVLDDITRNTEDHFASRNFHALKFDDQSGTMQVENRVNDFIPGEDIAVQAVAYTNENFSNVARSEQKVTNSLFAGIEDKTGNTTPDVAYISNIRHLENLDYSVSKLERGDSVTDNNSEGKLCIRQAIQTVDLVWDADNTDESKKGFLQKIRKLKGDSASGISISYGQGDESHDNTDAGYYKPVVFDGNLYDGKGHSIKAIKVNSPKENAASKDAGLFGTMGNGTIKNLELIDFEITNTVGNAGALAGTLTGTTVSNVIARNTSGGTGVPTIKGINAGGLIGELTGGTAKYSAASVIVEGGQSAGGLIGKAVANNSGSASRVFHCYSGGHTKNGSYNEWIKMDGHDYDVKATADDGVAGGLIGVAGTSTIRESYSTCSVSGSANAGGFVGTATVENKTESGTQTIDGEIVSTQVTKASISDCYCTGLVKLKTQTSTNTAEGANPNSGMGAFAGSLKTPSNATEPGEAGVKPVNCGCFEIINEVTKGESENTAGTYERYLYPVADAENNPWGIQAIDGDTESYDNFVKDQDKWDPAEVYDNALKTYYNKDGKAKYNLRTVDQLPVPADGGKIKSKEPDSFTDDFHRFVITHYGDWPAPEIFIINSAS